MSAHEYSIPRELRGYARHEVDRLLRNFDANVQRLQQEHDRLSARLANAEGELEIAQKELLKAQQSKPNFAGLGSKFEEVLRVAEDQAEKLLADANSEAAMIATETAAAVQRRNRESEETAERLISDARARAEELRLSGESAAAELTARANNRLTEAGETLASAKREAARMRSETETEIVQMKLAAQEQVDEQRRELHRLQEETENRVLTLEREIAARQEEAEIEHTRAHEEALRNAQAILDESNAKAADINRRAHEVAQESEVLHARVQLHVEEQERTSREQARELIDGAQGHADRVLGEVQEFSDNLLARALTRLEQTRHEVELVQEFVSRQRSARKTDTVIAELEHQLRQS